MHRLGYILSITILLIACSRQRNLTIKDIDPKHIWLKIWNEDTVKPYILTMYNKNSFLYEIVHKTNDGKIDKTIYSGTYISRMDTVFLKFKSKKQPVDIQPFLIKESTSNFLIQQFNDNSPRVFFRLPNHPRHGIIVF